MSTTGTHRLVDDYLRRLETAAAHLPRARRAELVAEIRGHIEAALETEDAAEELAVRNVLDRLGPPEEIVDAAEPAPATRPRARPLDVAAVVAFLVPFAGWLVGIVLVLVSDAWARRDKAIGIALALLPVLAPLLVVSTGSGSGVGEPVPAGQEPLASDSGDESDAGAAVVTVLILLAGLPAALFLGWRLRRRPSG